MKKRNSFGYLLFSILCFLLLFICNCAGMAASAEEYFSIGMAYFDLGRFEEAERWLNRARQADRTMVASTYNLGRLAFERRRYNEAARHFESILKQDPDNVLALRAAAYTRIASGEIDIADIHYSRLLALVPESSDDGYNHALVLFAMERYSLAQEVLEKYPFALLDSKDPKLLYARILAAQDKIEAINAFSEWLSLYSDPKARYEYAQVLERHEFYARALEEYRLSLSQSGPSQTDLDRNNIRFAIARTLLIADSESSEGVSELESAIHNGFNNVEAIEELLNDGRISANNAAALRAILNNLNKAQEEETGR